MSEGPMNCMIIRRTYLKSEGDPVYKCIFVKAIFMISMFYGSSYLKSGDIALKCLQHNKNEIIKDL